MVSVGMVGLPNVGKSTLFNAITQSHAAESANYPFCTIEPTTGIAVVPDPRLEKLAKLSKSEKIIPAHIEVIDIAGLVKGASSGQGLGNQFLAAIREVDAMCHVVRDFSDENIQHVSAAPHPKDDIAVIHTELQLADLATMEKRCAAAEKKARAGNNEDKEASSFLQKVKKALEEGQSARSVPIENETEEKALKECSLLTSKPELFAVNVSPEALATFNAEKWKSAHGLSGSEVVVAVSAQLEAELIGLEKAEAAEFLSSFGLIQPSLGAVIAAGYAALDMMTFFTTGPTETRGWQVKRGSTAPEAAGVIHTDFQEKFIRAEVVGAGTLIADGSFTESKAVGHVATVGKDYVLQDGDVCHFLHGA